jgi:membrane protease YdiL (CAAX protease family)
LHFIFPEEAFALTSARMVGAAAPVVVIWLTRGQSEPEWRLPNANRKLRWLTIYLIMGVLFVFPAQSLIKTHVDSELARQVIVHGSSYTYYLIVPSLLLVTGFWRWPSFDGSLDRGRLTAVAAFTLICFLTMSYFINPFFQGPYTPPRVVLALLSTFVDAAAEEVLFRVLLLSYLCAVIGSKSGSLLISSLTFGWMHWPVWVINLELPGSAPINDWIDGDTIAMAMWLTGAGMLLGVVWLRTRSFALVAVAHTSLNAFQSVSQAPQVWA